MAVEPGGIAPSQFRSAGMVCAGGPCPVACFRVQAGEETRRVAGVGEGVEHLGERGEGVAMPFGVDLEAPDIDAARATGDLLEDVSACGLFGVEPVTLPPEVDGPGPGYECP